MPAEYAAGMLLQLVEPTELKKEMYEAVEQAYNGLNANYGDYMKKVLALGDLHFVLGSKFKLEGKVLTVPHGCTLDEIDAFLKTVRGQA
jgi:hypothetical protein